ncbi:alginate lyase family protein [Bacillus sp. B4EP4a]|uniref:alginate lyase family protein n=1 Tax=Bacillus sp. B4EP4a TaxID=2590665 RepID=UPI00115001FD|nr:alginate lyase family protein [Bacillus sp. B4EP4a]
MRELASKIKRLKTLSVEEAVKKIAIKLYEIPYYKFRKERIKLKPININSDPFFGFTPDYQFFFNSNDKKKLINKIKSIDAYDQIIGDANKICSHEFNLLGSGDVLLGIKLPWNKDFKSGYIWENEFYKDIKIVDLNNNADVKVPWELSRFQHLFTLGKAYWVTGNEKYAIEFVDEIDDWIEKNPVEMSVNWTCTMDVGIRAVNWIAASSFFKESKSINENFWLKFNKSLYLHGRFIKKNLENKSVHTGNHYLSNIVGLVWLGIYFNSFTISDVNRRNNPKKWLEYGLKEMEKEMFVQNNPDGTNYEASTSYHRLVTELFLLTTIICKKNDIYFTKNYMGRLEKMCEFIMNITKPNGLSPIIGDADDGRLLILSNYSTWIRNDFRHLLGIAGELFDRDDFRYYGKEYSEDAFWIHQYFKSDVEKPKPLSSIDYKDGGYFILRNDRVYCCIRCGELSFRGEGVHSHNDQLSFELNVDGEDFIVDPGTYIYTADYKMRNLFRSTAMHNTVQIEGQEQNVFEDKNLFYMKEQTFARSLKFNNSFFEGEHVGYKEKIGVTHNRKIFLKEDRIIFRDVLDGINNNTNLAIFSLLNLSPNVTKDIRNKTIYLQSKQSVISFHCTNYELDHGFVSNAYGKFSENQKFIIPFNENIQIEIMF